MPLGDRLAPRRAPARPAGHARRACCFSTRARPSAPRPSTPRRSSCACGEPACACCCSRPTSPSGATRRRCARSTPSRSSSAAPRQRLDVLGEPLRRAMRAGGAAPFAYRSARLVGGREGMPVLGDGPARRAAPPRRARPAGPSLRRRRRHSVHPARRAQVSAAEAAHRLATASEVRCTEQRRRTLTEGSSFAI